MDSLAKKGLVRLAEVAKNGYNLGFPLWVIW
jgi:hypothetical protein